MMFDERYYKKAYTIKNIYRINKLSSMPFKHIFEDSSFKQLNADMAFDIMVRTYERSKTYRCESLVAALIVCGVDVSEHDDFIKHITDEFIDVYKEDIRAISSTGELSLFVLMRYTKTDKKYDFADGAYSLYGVNHSLDAIRYFIEKKYITCENFNYFLNLPQIIVCLSCIDSPEVEYFINRFRLSSPSSLSSKVNTMIHVIRGMKSINPNNPLDAFSKDFEHTEQIIREFIEEYANATKVQFKA